MLLLPIIPQGAGGFRAAMKTSPLPRTVRSDPALAAERERGLGRISFDISDSALIINAEAFEWSQWEGWQRAVQKFFVPEPSAKNSNISLYNVSCRSIVQTIYLFGRLPSSQINYNYDDLVRILVV